MGSFVQIGRHERKRLLHIFQQRSIRVMLKTLARAPRVTAQGTNEVIREYYRSDVWSEHSTYRTSMQVIEH